MPKNLSNEPAFHNDKPLEFGIKVPHPAESNIPETVQNGTPTNGYSNGNTAIQYPQEPSDGNTQFLSNEEAPVSDTSLLPTLKPLPEEAQF